MIKEGEIQLLKEGADQVLRINYDNRIRIPKIEEDADIMEEAIDALLKNPSASKIIYEQKHDYEYDYSQVKYLKEIAMLHRTLFDKKAIINPSVSSQMMASKYSWLKGLVWRSMKRDPVGSYLELHRERRHEEINLDKSVSDIEFKEHSDYIKILDLIIDGFENTALISSSKPSLAGYQAGDRKIYSRFFKPSIKPDFMFTKLMASYPRDGKELESYDVGETEIIVFETSNSVLPLYHIMPPEFLLDEEEYEVLDVARDLLSDENPEEQKFVDPSSMRDVFINISRDLLHDVAEKKGVILDEEQMDRMSKILVRYTVGFGLIEVLLSDPNVQDITVNSPMGQMPIYIVHGKYGECSTNIIPSQADGENWASKLRLISGRPLDEASPVLDTEIEIPGVANARVGVISPPLNPEGIAYAFRRHRSNPWTLALFAKNRMINPLAAGLISFIIDGNRTLLIAGTRSAGKSSLLGGIMVEMMRKYRIITIEDTLELPVPQLRKLGYNIQNMKVAGALSKGQSEVPADEGIRTTLRLGDSALIVGEVRSKEAKALYEAMRVGALANVVAGTIHGDSPYGVYDRVVNDLDVPATSFKATDIIIVANPIKTADGLHKVRRVTQITEVRKQWEKDPLAEKGFVDLMKYNPKTDELEPTEELIRGDSDVIKNIASNIKEYSSSWDAVWENIELRAKVKEEIIKISDREEDPSILEAEFVINANDQFHKILQKSRNNEGITDNKKAFLHWKDWVEQAVKKKRYS